jgi:N-acetylglutamate synthase-like GNAT family acetyltransferase
MEIRVATEADFDTVMRLINTAFAIELSFKVRDRVNRPELEEYFRKGNFLLSEENGRATGCVFVERTGERAYMGLLSVDPSLQKQGLGRRLVAAAEEFARELGAHHMDLTVVNIRTELLDIYGKLGYRDTGITEPFPPTQLPTTQPCHLIRMSKELGHR